MYKQQVLKILMDVGEHGMSAALLSKHVYNMNCTLFYQPDVDEIRRWVWQYLQRNAQSRKPLIERTGKHGFYRLNKRGISYMRKLRTEAENKEKTEKEPVEQQAEDTSPGFFDDIFSDNP